VGQLAKDPDQLALERARADVGALLEEWGHQTTRTQCEHIVRTAIFAWLRYRFAEWSRNRAIASIGKPDAYVLGAAEAVLPLIGSLSLPWEKPVGEWAKDDVLILLAIGFEAITEQQARTLEDPDQHWIEVATS
jgi:hypothetical protein